MLFTVNVNIGTESLLNRIAIYLSVKLHFAERIARQYFAVWCKMWRSPYSPFAPYLWWLVPHSITDGGAGSNAGYVCDSRSYILGKAIRPFDQNP